MQKIVLLFLGDADRATINYQGIEQKLAKDYAIGQYIASNDIDQIQEFFAGFNTDHESLLITILAHGGADCISAKMTATDWNRLPYSDLLRFIAACRTENSLTLNLVAPCNTVNVIPSVATHNIDEVWYTIDESDSLHFGLTAAEQGFIKFSFMDEKNLFFRYQR
ncbi:hypothetical protein [Mucilaginibacter sp. UYCu711]|uniref:hypothetical protein n=1 Tax=Mucilaginibacter sp. UYCu711 TaxID=3156339 RepID=UPI003D20734C